MKKVIIFLTLSLSIALFSCKKEDAAPAQNSGNNNNTLTGMNTVTGEILSFNNITFGGINNQSIIGSYFSIKNNKVYKSTELNSTIGPDIDLVYIGLSGGLSFFEGGEASNSSLTSWGYAAVPGGVKTKIINYTNTTSSGVNFTVANFDNMTNDTPVKNLTIVVDNESFSISDAPLIVAFMTASNKKGVVKVKSGVSGKSGHIVCDIKVQK